MAFVAAFPKAFKNVLLSALVAASLAAAFQFEVGENIGWKKPTGKEPKTYNEWAAQNRFHIGDTVHFKYEKDSLLVVTSANYLTCNASNPISQFEDGSTVFLFDRPGFFYFISGQPGHCKSGQRLIVRVMHPSQIAAPEIAPSPAPVGGFGGDTGGDSGEPSSPHVSSSVKLFVVSYCMTAIAGLLVMLYLFM